MEEVFLGLNRLSGDKSFRLDDFTLALWHKTKV